MMLRSIPKYFIELFILCYITTSIFSCQPPDSPVGGSYQPEQTRYLPGDKVVYSCQDRLTRIGKDTRVCQTTGKWSGSTPFCDSPTRVKNPSASSDPKGRVKNVVDGSPDTCFQTNGTEQSLKVYLDPPAAVYMIRIYLQEGNAKLAICQRKGRTAGPFCITEDVRNIEKKQWVTLECKDNDVQADYIEIQDFSEKTIILAICEIEVFVKDEVWCKHPPDIFIPNGRLEVSRGKASLRCAEGYRKSLETRMVCEKNTWIGPILQCEEILCNAVIGNGSLSGGEWRRLTNTGQATGKLSVGTERKLICNSGFRVAGKPDIVTCLKHGSWSSTTATCIANEPDKKPIFKIIAIAVGSVIVILIFFLLGLTLFLIQKKRHREVVVIYKPSEDAYTPPSLNSASTAACSDAEYSTVYYEAIRHNGPPPMPTRPSPYLKKGYTQPVDDSSPQEVMVSSSNPLPTDIAFGTLKSSSLYNTMQ